MGKNTRGVQRDRVPQARLNALIVKKPEPIVVERPRVKPRPVLFCDVPYDTMHPEDVLRNFTASVRDMIARYNGNQERLAEIESRIQDILHFIEMSRDKNTPEGYKLYRELRVSRRERRACKNEIDLLQPVYDAFGGTDLLNRLAQVQGECRNAKIAIDSRSYKVRTDVLDAFTARLNGPESACDGRTGKVSGTGAETVRDALEAK